MYLKRKQLWQFEEFSYDPETRALLRQGEAIFLAPLARGTLDYLLRNRNRIVSKRELKAALWEGVSVVEDNSVEKQIAAVRKALGTRATGKAFIETRYKLGWQFVADVNESTSDDCERSNEHPVVLDEPEHVQGIAGRNWRLWLSCALAAFLAAAAVAALSPAREPRVLEFDRVTHDGGMKLGHLLANGRRVFFEEQRNGGIGKLMSVPISGGDPEALAGIDHEMVLADISPAGDALLLIGQEKNPVGMLTMYSLADSVSHPLNKIAMIAVWGPKDDEITYWDGQWIRTLKFKTGECKDLFDFGGRLQGLAWSPDKRHLRYWASDLGGEPQGVWEFDYRDKSRNKLRAFPQWMQNGVWTPDGAHFLMIGGSYLQQNIWVARKKSLFRDETPVTLANGPGYWQSVARGADNSAIFAVQKEERPEVVSYDFAKKTWSPLWDGYPAYEFNYSPDGKWVAFVHEPDHTIWKARPDGSERTQLVFLGMTGNQPHWSPDGKRIAFMGQQKANGAFRIYIISADGGPAWEVLPEGDDQGVPTWSADGRSIIYGERLGKKAASAMMLRVIDTVTHKVRVMAGSEGLWSPRWSPDGKHILAATTDWRGIRVLSTDGVSWKELVRMLMVDNAAWSSDSAYIYFDARQPKAAFDMYRVEVASGKIERLADLKDLVVPQENWYGVAPDGTLLASRAYMSSEVFRLKCDLQ